MGALRAKNKWGQVWFSERSISCCGNTRPPRAEPAKCTVLPAPTHCVAAEVLPEWGPIWREGLSGRITNSIQIRVRLICSLKGEFNQGGSLVFISNATKFKGSANSICRRYTMFSNTSSKDGHWPVAWAMA